MVNTNSKTPIPEVPVLGQDGRNPPLASRSKDGFTALKGMRESTRYGILLYFLLNSVEWPLSEGQVLWIVHRSKKLSLSELQRSSTFLEELFHNEKTFSRMRREILDTYYRVPSLNPKRIPEKRTIGIGYRDKGSLRPLHEQRSIGEEVFWNQDLAYLLPYDKTEEGAWVTAEEVQRQVGMDHLILALASIRNQTLSGNLDPNLAEKPRSG